MEGTPPFDPDDLDFDFESSRRRRLERDTGERRVEPEPDEPPSDEHAEPPSEETPSDTGEDSSGTGEYGTGEDPFDTGQRRHRRESRRGGLLGSLRLGRRPSRRRDRTSERTAAATDTGERERLLRDDPYTPAEVPVPGSRRSRHRDLPAKVRRRQAVLLGVGAFVVLLLIVVAANAIFGGGGDDEDEPLPLKKLAGQSIIAKLGKGGPDAELLRRARKGQIGGVIVTAPTDPQTLSGQVDQLQQAASDGDNPQLLVMIDQEGGEVKRLDGPPNVDPPDLGEAGADAARSEGEETGNFLKTAKVNVDLAPVLDVELPQTADSIAERTFSDDAAVVSEVGTAFIQGLQSTGVAATAKHFPGLGPATLNTDDSAVTIDAVRDETLQEALQPFQAAVDAGVELVMVSSAIYPDYGPENPKDPNRPASTVPAIVDGLLRNQLGYRSVIITDDLQSVAIETLTTPEVAGWRRSAPAATCSSTGAAWPAPRTASTRSFGPRSRRS